MVLPLVVGVDGSESSLQAVDWAADEAGRHEAPLRVVYGSLWERYEGVRPSVRTERPAEQVMAEHIAASCEERARLRNPELKVTSDVSPSDGATALLREGPEALALVTGSRGRGELAGLLLGSVSLAVAGRAVCPVIVVRGSERNVQGRTGRVVLGVGDPRESSAAIRFALREAVVRNSELCAVLAWQHPRHQTADHPLMAGEAPQAHEERAAAVLSDALHGADEGGAPRVRRQITEGPARKILLEASAEADLLVVGAPRRHGSFGLQLGRVAHTLLHHSDCPVAVVPQRA